MANELTRKQRKYAKERKKILILPEDLFGKYIHSSMPNFLRTVDNKIIDINNNVDILFSQLLQESINFSLSKLTETYHSLFLLEIEFYNKIKFKYDNADFVTVKKLFLKDIQNKIENGSTLFNYIRDFKIHMLSDSINFNKQPKQSDGTRASFDQLLGQMNNIQNEFQKIIDFLNDEVNNDLFLNNGKQYQTSKSKVLEKNSGFQDLKEKLSNINNIKDNDKLRKLSKDTYELLPNILHTSLGWLVEIGAQQIFEDVFADIFGKESFNVEVVGQKMMNSKAVFDLSLGSFGGVNVKSQLGSYDIERSLKNNDIDQRIMNEFLSSNPEIANIYNYLKWNIAAFESYNPYKSNPDFPLSNLKNLSNILTNVEKNFFGSYFLISALNGIAEDVTEEAKSRNWQSLLLIFGNGVIFTSDIFLFFIEYFKKGSSFTGKSVIDSTLKDFVEASFTHNRKISLYSSEELKKAHFKKLKTPVMQNDDDRYRAMAGKITSLLQSDKRPKSFINKVKYKIKINNIFNQIKI